MTWELASPAHGWNCPLLLTWWAEAPPERRRWDYLLCEDLVARYWGESGDSGHCRTFSLVTAVEMRDKENAFAKHLSTYL